MYDTYKKKLLNGENWKQKSKGHGPNPILVSNTARTFAYVYTLT